MSELKNTAIFLGEKFLITEPTLAEIKKEIDEYFKDKNYSKNQYSEYTIAMLSLKVLELEKERDQWKETATKHQTTNKG